MNGPHFISDSFISNSKHSIYFKCLGGKRTLMVSGVGIGQQECCVRAKGSHRRTAHRHTLALCPRHVLVTAVFPLLYDE